tara:strand:+ start:574 stop:1221 length:648 start_codon:yes stop_codon:yes gene_type:complete
MTDKEELSRGDALAKVAALEAELAQKSLLVREMDLMFGRMLLGMRAAVIEEEHGKGAEAAMVWIFNGLVGPGELPPEEEKDAQAYFDREVTAIDEGMKQIMDERKAMAAAPAPVERVEQEAMRKRFDQIEREVCEGKRTAASVFTQMRTAALYTTPQPAPAAQDVAGLVEALEWCEKWFSRHSPTAALISGEHATHPMLSSIRAALAAHQSGGAK